MGKTAGKVKDEGKAFSFEKKNQKTFNRLAPPFCQARSNE